MLNKKSCNCLSEDWKQNMVAIRALPHPLQRLIFIIFLIICFYLKDNCFIELCCFLSNINMNPKIASCSLLPPFQLFDSYIVCTYWLSTHASTSTVLKLCLRSPIFSWLVITPLISSCLDLLVIF